MNANLSETRRSLVQSLTKLAKTCGVSTSLGKPLRVDMLVPVCVLTLRPDEAKCLHVVFEITLASTPGTSDLPDKHAWTLCFKLRLKIHRGCDESSPKF